MWESIIDIQDEVKEAIEKNLPVVALESTIISHGMPYPDNKETARQLEGIIRAVGAVPATIGIVGGRIKVGLGDEELELLAKESDIVKVSRRDFPEVIALKKNGATTVAGTMIVASKVGIKVFATGGIGGVHRGYDTVLDISQDLVELSKTNVAVVCAGVKSILDIRSTLEYLETLSVPVYVYQANQFPAFYTRDSGIEAENRIDELGDLAQIIQMKWSLGLDGGVVIANPIPEEAAYDKGEISDMIEMALLDAKADGITGKAVTPYLLDRIKTSTEGRSLEANISLVRSNAVVAAQLAKKMINI